MQKSVEFTGKTEELAISTALSRLGLAREEVSVEVLQLARSGFLGIGGTPAKIKVTYEVPDEPAPPLPAPPPAPAEPEKKPEKIVYEAPEIEKPEPKKAEKKKQPKTPKSSKGPQKAPGKEPGKAPGKEPAKPAKKQQENRDSESAVSLSEDERAEKINSFLKGLLERMDVPATPEISVDEEGNYQVRLEGENLGQLIGRRGETLDAIQQITGYVVNRGQSRRVRVRVDAENYRAKREDTLIRMARRMADKAVRSRRNVTLEPMNAYERHVIHTALQDWPDVTTYSVGVEPGRRTVIAYSPGEHRK